MEARFSLFRYFPFPCSLFQNPCCDCRVSKSLLRFGGVKKFLLRLRGVKISLAFLGGYKILLRSRGVKFSLASMGDYSAFVPLTANHWGYFFDSIQQTGWQTVKMLIKDCVHYHGFLFVA